MRVLDGHDHIRMLAALLLLNGPAFVGSDLLAGEPLCRGDADEEKAAAKQKSVHDAATSSNLRPLCGLLRRDPNLANARDEAGNTPLHAAARRGRADVARLLLGSGASPTAIDDDGYTPLTIAVRRGNLDASAVDLLRGADHGVTDNCYALGFGFVRSTCNDNLYGPFQLAFFNSVGRDFIGVSQLGAKNAAGRFIGLAQIGFVDVATDYWAPLQLGFASYVSRFRGAVQTGLFWNEAGDFAGLSQITLGANLNDFHGDFFGALQFGLFANAVGNFYGLLQAPSWNLNVGNHFSLFGQIGILNEARKEYVSLWQIGIARSHAAHFKGLLQFAAFNSVWEKYSPGGKYRVTTTEQTFRDGKLADQEVLGIHEEHRSPRICCGDFKGLAQIGLVNVVGGDFYGLLEVGLIANYVNEEAWAAQVGLVNVTGRMRGLQIGVVNVASNLKGLQIGAVNYARNSLVRFMPVLNLGF
ncbi:MAG: ankyrin repeat domain-containing protein [Deltaproteobacteria bacterium]|nr:ankyrin repeat domain-containing protein [Deltaproteobacteria bacterium]